MTGAVSNHATSMGPRIVLAGSVSSSQRTLDGLLRNGGHLVGVLGLSNRAAGKVSGYVSLEQAAHRAGLDYFAFEKINDEQVIEIVRRWQPDLLFVVGLSQLVHQSLLAIPRIGSVGFHPTMLPEGRGRAPLAWLVLEGRRGAATFFQMDAGVDSGPILAQEPFEVGNDDYADDVVRKMEVAIDNALDRWIPRLVAGEWLPEPQSHDQATYYGVRGPEDGLIDWRMPAADIERLVRAAGQPHPGAYTYVGRHRLVVWRATAERSRPIHGAPGRILDLSDDGGILVQTGDIPIWLTKTQLVVAADSDTIPRLRLGQRLGYVVDDELNTLRTKVRRLELRLAELERQQTAAHEAET